MSGSQDTTAVLWDVTRPAAGADALKAATPADLWAKLDAPAAADAFPALVELAARPAEAVALVRAGPPPAVNPKADADGDRPGDRPARGGGLRGAGGGDRGAGGGRPGRGRP